MGDRDRLANLVARKGVKRFFDVAFERNENE